MKNQTHFYVAMYLRLSRDDGDRDGTSRLESNSIGSQREMIRSFLREQEDMELYDSYVDDGFSGGNFQRPEFERMMEDVNGGRVNCVIVKDLSRFGRDYIETGNIWNGYSRLLEYALLLLPTIMTAFRLTQGRGILYFR